MSTWDKPQEVDDVTFAFPARVIGTLLPPMEEIPEEFHYPNIYGGKYKHLADSFNFIFYGEKDKNDALHMRARPGIDIMTAGRHLLAIAGSFQPKHEHKVSGWCFLADKWFDLMKLAPRPADLPKEANQITWDQDEDISHL